MTEDIAIPFYRGLALSIPIDTVDVNFTAYTIIEAEIKEELRITAPSVLSLSLGSGIAVTSVTVEDVTTYTIVLNLTDTQTKALSKKEYHIDIKGRVTPESPIVPLVPPFQLKKEETVTDI